MSAPKTRRRRPPKTWADLTPDEARYLSNIKRAMRDAMEPELETMRRRIDRLQDEVEEKLGRKIDTFLH